MLVAIKKSKNAMKKVLHEKSVHEKSVSFVLSQKNLFVPKISKNIFLPEQEGQGQQEEELSLPVLLL